jgi:hypothetical protein
LAAADPRVKAIATVAGFLPEPTLVKGMFGEAELNRRREAAATAKSAFKNTSKETNVTAYSETDQTAANYFPQEGAFDFYLNAKRGKAPQYKNELAVMSFETMYDFDPISKVSAIKVPAMIVHSDGSTFPEQAKKFYSLLGGKKEPVWGDGNHLIAHYYSPLKLLTGLVSAAFTLCRLIVSNAISNKTAGARIKIIQPSSI